MHLNLTLIRLNMVFSQRLLEFNLVIQNSYLKKKQYQNNEEEKMRENERKSDE